MNEQLYPSSRDILQPGHIQALKTEVARLDDQIAEMQRLIRRLRGTVLNEIELSPNPKVDITITQDEVEDIADDVMEIKTILIHYPCLLNHVIRLMSAINTNGLRTNALDLLEHAAKGATR